MKLENDIKSRGETRAVGYGGAADALLLLRLATAVLPRRPLPFDVSPSR